MTEPPDPRVDELRRQLRSLGYLDAGVDRFLLGSARQQGRPLSLATRASLRVGLLGGVLLFVGGGMHPPPDVTRSKVTGVLEPTSTFSPATVKSTPVNVAVIADDC